jgi:hypothetical protein
VTYGGDDGDGLVDNNNALTTMASALKIFAHLHTTEYEEGTNESGKNSRALTFFAVGSTGVSLIPKYKAILSYAYLEASQMVRILP